jgi:oxygen-dependent protoporphyrinogen oxidase
MPSFDCIIIGAGISGLSAAYALQKRGAKVLVVEQQGKTGGALFSEQTNDGFVLDHGAQTISSSDTALWSHFEELGIAQSLTESHSQRIYLPHEGKLEPLMLSPLEMVRTPMLSVAARARLLFEPFLPRAVTNDESIAQFFSRRLGPDFAEKIIAPFVSGVYGGDLHELSVRSLFPGLWKMDQQYGSLLGGLLASGTGNGADRQQRKTFSFQQGLSTWTDALTQAIGEEALWLNTIAQTIQQDGQQWRVTVEQNGKQEELETDRVILAVPASVAGSLVQPFAPEATTALQAIKYPPLTVVHLAYQETSIDHPLDGMGMLCAQKDACHVLGVLWMSTIFSGRAPDGYALTTTFVGGTRSPNLARYDDASLLSVIKQEHRQYLGTRSEPVMERIVRWEHAIPQYDAAHTQRVAATNRLEARWPGVYLLSNYRYGFSVEQCWNQAQELAAHVVLVR